MFEQAKPGEERGMKERRNWRRWRKTTKMEDTDTFYSLELPLSLPHSNILQLPKSAVTLLWIDQNSSALPNIKSTMQLYENSYLYVLIILSKNITDTRETITNQFSLKEVRSFLGLEFFPYSCSFLLKSWHMTLAAGITKKVLDATND